MKSSLILSAIIAIVLSQDPPPPVWDEAFSVPVNQTIYLRGKAHNNIFMLNYDSTTKPYGSSLYVHSKGQFDELCQ